MAEIRDIKLPMTEEDVKSLKLGEMITVSGLLFTGRSRLHIRAIEDKPSVFHPVPTTSEGMRIMRKSLFS